MASRKRKHLHWETLDNDELLDVRLCDLGLQIEGTTLEQRINQLYDELARAGLRFRPHIWLSYDWFTPDSVVGFAVPFYLAHRRLIRLEHKMMLEVEGGNHIWCMKLLRHETAHAIDNAYRLHWKKSWRETFGSFAQKYDDVYAPDPTSTQFVQHLGYWYSQSHPAEDWAECFSVWLRPGGRWRSRYDGWPVMKKLKYVDELLQSLQGEKMKVRKRTRPDALPSLTMTLRDYYARKQDTYAEQQPIAVDRYLYRLFSDDPSLSRRTSAASFLRKFQIELRNRVASTTHQSRYLVEQALDLVIMRCRELNLRLIRSAADSKIDASILITMMTMHFAQGTKPEYRR